MEILTIQDWSLSIGDPTLVGPVSCTLQQGHVLGIIGESGSGKTVLTRALLGQYPHGSTQTGTMDYHGVSMRTFSADRWHDIRGQEIGYMAQQPMSVFNSCQTIFSHAHEFLASHDIKSHDEIHARMCKALTDCNLPNPEDILRRYPFELSGGMLQRCMMAMLLALDVKVLICDEPTSALDSFNTKVLIDCLQAVKQQGKTMIVVTHDYEVLTALADEVLVLRQGKQMEYGTATEVLMNPQTAYAKELLTPPWRGRYHDDRSAARI